MSNDLNSLLRRPQLVEVDGTAQPFGQLGANSHGSVTIDFRFKNGNRRALPYAYLYEIDLNKSGTLTMLFTGHKVTVVGRSLERLYAALLDHRVRFIREGELGQEHDSDVFIESIRLQEAE